MTETSKSGLPGLMHVDHVALTVPDLDAAVEFYSDVIGGVPLYRIGPFDAKEMPAMDDGRDWCEAHVNVADARLTIAMLQVGPNLMLELFQYDRPIERRASPPRNCDLGGHHIAFKVSDIDRAIQYLKERRIRVMSGPMAFDEGPCAGLRVIYFLDPWGNQLELVEYQRQGFEASCAVRIYRQAAESV
ncbi:MAG TPA: VOC family protein [Eoetvoesiella sp.]|uniref:VOC family protein n=1 Tax=Eoetvoesiella sp. TaxID=1966355 RepID=UPI002CF883DC|nr:VOC family protein [Eoetvoesiella sp.]HWK61037.1 VOC family protein [Eoetvoesiella sp.]